MPEPQHPTPAAPWPGLRWSFADAAKERAGETAGDWRASKAAESRYERQLTSVANQVGRIMHAGGSPEEVEAKLREYAKILEPWAKQSAATMVLGVNRKNVNAWRGMAKKMGEDMRQLIDGPGVGEAVRRAIAENARKITSLPFDEADRVGTMIRENMAAGSRADDLAKRIAENSNASLSRAKTIARTEVSKAQVALTRTRAESIGSTGYIWRTAADGDVRPSHRAMEGKFVPWDEPPTLDGMTGHAGEFPNDRCYPEPVVPREDAAGNKAGVYTPPLQTRAEAAVSGQKSLYSKWEQQEMSRVIPHAPGSPLVGVEKATADMHGKLVQYSLNPEHPTGKHKATVWKAAIGATQEHADMIREQVIAFLPYAEATFKEADTQGEKYNVMVPVTGPNGKTVDVLTAWIYDRDQKTGKKISMRPRLTTIFVPGKNNAF